MATPVIIRETVSGDLIAIFPTLPANIRTGQNTQWMNSKGWFVNSTETYEELTARTSEVSLSKQQKYMEKHLKRGYRLVEKATNAMHRQRASVDNDDLVFCE